MHRRRARRSSQRRPRIPLQKYSIDLIQAACTDSTAPHRSIKAATIDRAPRVQVLTLPRRCRLPDTIDRAPGGQGGGGCARRDVSVRIRSRYLVSVRDTCSCRARGLQHSAVGVVATDVQVLMTSIILTGTLYAYDSYLTVTHRRGVEARPWRRPTPPCTSGAHFGSTALLGIAGLLHLALWLLHVLSRWPHHRFVDKIRMTLRAGVENNRRLLPLRSLAASLRLA